MLRAPRTHRCCTYPKPVPTPYPWLHAGKGMDTSRLRLVADAPNPVGTAAAPPTIALDLVSSLAVEPAVVHPGCDLRVEERPPGDVGPALESKASTGARAGGAAAGGAGPAAAPVAEGVAAAAPAAAKTGTNVSVKAKKVGWFAMVL